MVKRITELLPNRCVHADESETRKAKDIDLEQYFICALCTGYDTECKNYRSEKK